MNLSELRAFGQSQNLRATRTLERVAALEHTAFLLEDKLPADVRGQRLWHSLKNDLGDLRRAIGDVITDWDRLVSSIDREPTGEELTIASFWAARLADENTEPDHRHWTAKVSDAACELRDALLSRFADSLVRPSPETLLADLYGAARAVAQADIGSRSHPTTAADWEQFVLRDESDELRASDALRALYAAIAKVEAAR